MIKSNLIQCLGLILLCFLFGCQQKSSVLNQKASIITLGDLEENPLLLNAITTAVDLNKNKMSTLYANQKAANYARGYKGTDFPKGSRFYQVTWQKQPDSLWYGAYMPGKLISVERITFNQDYSPKYTLYTSELIQQKSSNDSLRIVQILSQPRAVSP